MIVFYRIASVAPGKTASAIEFAKGIAGHMKSTHGVELEVKMPVGGNPQRIGWAARYANLAALDAVTEKLLGDQKYWEKIAKASDCFIAGSMHDSIWRTM
jgi:hypothetical protein